MLAGACERNERDEASVPVAGQAGAVASAGSTGGLEINVGGGTAGGGAPAGGRPAVDLSTVQMPVVRCAAIAAGGAGGAAEEAAAGAAGSVDAEPSTAGAAWDETCSPPPSTCLGDITLVYFDEGECVAGFCEWHKASLDCISSCLTGGCQDSITTK
jgi:hypothetical protein